jgi:iron complex transport system permease protein
VTPELRNSQASHSGAARPPEAASAAGIRRGIGPLAGLALLGAALGILFAVGLAAGSVRIPLRDAALGLFGHGSGNPIRDHILRDIRLPRCLAAVFGGACLGLSGLLMQTLFRNPLAGPYSMGVSSGATLGVALAVLAGSAPAFGPLGLWASFGAAGAAVIGSLAVMALVLAVSRRVRDNATLLILGLMFGQLASAAVSVLQAFSRAEELRAFTFWTFGSFAGVTWGQMPALAGAFAIGTALSAVCAKPLNALLLGENYARSLGVSLPATRGLLLAGASILAGGVTAFCGPVAFLGLVVPHLCRGMFRTADHRLLVPASALMGAALALASDLAASLPGSDRALPLNAVTALIGAPIVIRILMRQRRPG